MRWWLRYGKLAIPILLLALLLTLDEARGEFVRTCWYLPLGLGRPSVADPDDLREQVERQAHRIRVLEDQIARSQWYRGVGARRHQAVGALPSLPAEVMGAQLPAQVLPLKDFSSWNEHVMINRGRGDGVGERSVIAQGEALVGTVIVAGATVSRVRLLCDPSARVPVVFAVDSPPATGKSEPLSTRPRGVVAGSETTAGALRALWVPREDLARLSPGTAVFTSGDEGLFPKGLLVGTVESVRDRPGEAFLDVTLRPAARLREVEFVEVLTLAPQSP